MKKLLKLTLCLMALLPMGAWAQTLEFSSYSDKSTEGAAAELTVQSGNFKGVFKCAKAKINAKSLTFALEGDASSIKTFSHNFGSGGGVARTDGTDRTMALHVPSKGKLTVYPRPDKDNTTLTIKQNSSNLLDAQSLTTSANVTISDKSYFKAYQVNVEAGVVYILTSDAVNFAAFTFEADAAEVVSPKVWDLSSLTTGTYQGTTDSPLTQDLGDGLYVHVMKGGSHVAEVSDAQSGQTTFTLLNGNSYTMTKRVVHIAYQLSNFTGAMSTMRTATDNMDKDYFSIDVTTAGTLYVIARMYDTPVEGGNQFHIVFQRAANDYTATSTEKINNKDLFEASAIADKAGTFHFFADRKYAIQTVVWVPGTIATISSAKIATFCTTKNVNIPDGVTAYVVADYDGDNNSVTLKKLNSVIPANTGVILESDEATSYSFTETSETESIERNYLVANTVPTIVLPTDGGSNYNYTLAADGFKHSTGVGTLAAGKAYLQIPFNAESSDGKLSLIFDDDETTGINNPTPSLHIGEGPMYNLAGQKVGKDYKGIVIVNGKKYINK